MKSIYRFLSLFLVVFLWGGYAFAQATFTWNGSSSSAWGTAANWTINSGTDADGVPDADDIVNINSCACANPVPILSANTSVTNLSVNGGSLNLNGKTLTITGTGFSRIFGTMPSILGNGTINSNGRLRSEGATFGGNIVMSGDLEFWDNTFNGTADLTHTPVGINRFNAGNTFKENTTLTINSASQWWWGTASGTGNPDDFQKNLTVNANVNNSFMSLASNSANNKFNSVSGRTVFNLSNSSQIHLGWVAGSSAVFTGELEVNNASTYTAANNSLRLPFEGQVTFNENVIINYLAAAGSQVSVRMADSNNSKVIFNKNLTVNSATNADRRFYVGFNNAAAQTADFSAASQISANFANGFFGMYRINQPAAAQNINLNLGTNARFFLRESPSITGNITVTAGQINVTNNQLKSGVSFTQTGALGDGFSGGNTIDGAAVLALTGGSRVLWGNAAPDIFNSTLNITANTTGNVDFILAHSAGNIYKGDVTINNQGNARVLTTWNNNATATFEGNLIINQAANATRDVSIGTSPSTNNIFQRNITINRTGGGGVVLGNDNTALITFEGNLIQGINTNIPTQQIRNMVINKASNRVVINNNLQLTRELTLTSGHVEVGANVVFDIVKNTITGGSNASHIIVPNANGVLRIRTDSGVPRIFPVGDGTNYLPFTLTQNRANNLDFNIRMTDNATAAQINKNWVVTHSGTAADAANMNATVIAQWNGANHNGGFNAASSALIRSGATLTALVAAAGTDPYTHTVAAVSGVGAADFGVFTVGSTISVNAGPNQTIGKCMFATMAGSVPPPGQTGTWSYVSGTPNSSGSFTAVAPTTLNDFNAVIGGLAVGTHVLRWTYSPSGAFSEVTITKDNTAGASSATSLTWTGANNNGDWFDCGNWNPVGVPTSAINATIPGGLGTAYPVLNANAQTKDLNITAGGRISLAGFTITASNNIWFTSAFVTAGTTSKLISVRGSQYRSSYFDGNINLTQKGPDWRSHGNNIFTGNATIRMEGNADMEWGRGDVANGGPDNFQGDLNIEFTVGGREMRFAHNTTGNNIGGNITVTNSSTGRVRIGNENTTNSTSWAAGKTLTAAAGMAAGSRLHIVNLTQATGISTHTHNLDNTGKTVDIYIYRSTFHGNMTLSARDVDLENNNFGTNNSNTISIKSAPANEQWGGGNTFNSPTIIELNGNRDWRWGQTGGEDKFKSSLDAKVQPAGTQMRWLRFANQSTGNEFLGTSSFHALGNGGILVGHENGSSAVFGAKATFLNECVQAQAAIQVARRATITFNGDVEILHTTNGFTGLNTFFANDSGSINFNGDVILQNLNNSVRDIYIGARNLNLPAQIKLAAGKRIKIKDDNAANFLRGFIRISNLQQLGTTAHTFNLPALVYVYMIRSQFYGNFDLTAGLIQAEKCVFGGNINNMNAIGSFSSSAGGNGGNKFSGTTTLTLSSTSGDWIWGMAGTWAGSDTFNIVTFNNTASRTLNIGNNTQDNIVYGDMTVNNTSTGSVSMTSETTGQYRVFGNFTANNSATNFLSLSHRGRLAVSGNIALNNTNTSVINVGTNATTRGFLVAEGNADRTLSVVNSGGGTYRIDNLEINKPNGALLTLLTDVKVGNEADDELRFITGRIRLLGNTLDLGLSTLTGADINSHIIANGTGSFRRRVPNVATLFPVATDSLYLPMTLTNAGTADLYNVRVRYDVNDRYDNATNNNPTGANITEYYTKPAWIVTEAVNGGSNLTARVEWNGSTDEYANFNRNLSALKRYSYTNNIWNCHGAESAATLVSGTRFFQQGSGINETGVFSVGTMVADAGGNKTFENCGFAVLSARVPEGTGPGVWTQVSGPVATIVQPTNPNTQISGLVNGTYVFRWTTGAVAACTTKFSDMTLTFNNAGASATPPALARWNGNANNGDWNDCLNWENNLLPASTSDVIIPFLTAANTQYPVLASNVEVKDFVMEANTRMRLNGNTLTALGENLVIPNAFVSAGTNSRIVHGIDTNTPASFTTVFFDGNITLQSPNIVVTGSTFTQVSVIEKQKTANDDWGGGNDFRNAATIVHRGNGGTLRLATQTGDLFRSAASFQILEPNGNIIPAVNGTTEFREDINTTSVRNADFNFGVDANSKVVITGTATRSINNGLQPGFKIVFRDLELNRTTQSDHTQIFRTVLVMDKLTFTRGRFWIRNNAVLSLQNDAPTALVGGGAMSFAVVEETGVLGRKMLNNSQEYFFPVGASGSYRGIFLTNDAADTPDEFFVRSHWQVRPTYNTSNVGSGAVYNEEYVNSLWIVTHQDATKTFNNFKIRPTWLTTQQANNAPPLGSFAPSRSFLVAYDYSSNKWNCISTYGNPDGGDGSTTTPFFKTSSNTIKDALSNSRNLGIFAVASATASARATQRAQENACLIVDLDATEIYEAPPLGTWTFVAAFTDATKTTQLNFASVTARVDNPPAGLGPEDTFPWPIFGNKNALKTILTNVYFNGIYEVNWARHSPQCGGTSTTPIDNRDAFVTITIGAAAVSTTQTWNGAVNTDWNNCANWSSGSPNNATFTAIIPGGAANYPVLPSNLTLKELIIQPGGKLDLDNKTLTVNERLEFTSALITDLGGRDASDVAFDTPDGKLNGFITINNIGQFRKTQFDGAIGIHMLGGAGGTARGNGGNIFMSATHIHHYGTADWIWGWTDNPNTTNSGGADVFHKDLDVIVKDCGANNSASVARLQTNYGTNRPTNLPTNFPTNFSNLNWIQAPYYIPYSGDNYTNVKVGFPDYRRIDTHPTNTSDPAIDSVNAAKNIAAELANRNDELQSIANEETASANVYAAYINARDAATNYQNSISAANTAISTANSSPSTTGAFPCNVVNATVIMRRDALNTLLATCNSAAAVISARDAALNAYNNKTNPPGNQPNEGGLGPGDHFAANAANTQANAANNCANQLNTAINQLYAALSAAHTACNVNIPAPPARPSSNIMLRLAYNTKGNEFKGNTNFLVENCGRLRISELTGADAKFTGENKTHTFINRSYAGSNDANNSIVTSVNTGTSMSFEGNNSRVDVQNYHTGYVIFSNRGTTDFKNKNSLTITSTELANRLYFGGGHALGITTLNQDFITTNVFDRGTVYLYAFRQVGGGYPVNFQTDRSAQLVIGRSSSFDGNFTFVSNRQNNAGTAGIGGTALLVATEAQDTVTFNGTVNLLNLPISTSAFQLATAGRIFLNADLTTENQNTNNGHTTFLGRGDMSVTTNLGAVYLADGKTIKVGDRGFISGRLVMDSLIQLGKTPQAFVMPSAGWNFNHYGNFVTCGPATKPCSIDGTRLEIYRSNIEAGVHMEAPDIGIRRSLFKDTAYVVAYFDGEVSGGNTFEKKATFEFRGKNGQDWIFGQNGADTFKDSLKIDNNGVNTTVRLNYGSQGTVFEGDVVLMNRGTPTGTNGNNFGIGGDPNNPSTAHFKKTLTIINRSTNDFLINGDNPNNDDGVINTNASDFITISGNLRIINQLAPYYVGANTCNAYSGDVRFAGGSTLIEATSNFTVENFQAGELQFKSVYIKGNPANDNLYFDLASQVAGDLGTARIDLDNSIFERRMFTRSQWIGFNGSKYHGDAYFERTNGCTRANMGNKDMEGKSNNIYFGNFELVDRSLTDAQIHLAKNGNAANVFTGDSYRKNAIFTLDPNVPTSKTIIVAHNYVSDFSGSLTLNYRNTAALNFASTSGIEFKGSGQQVITSSHPVEMIRLSMNQANAASSVINNQDLTIRGRAVFIKGKYILGATRATILNENNTISVSVVNPNQSHIVANEIGTVNRTVNNNAVNVLFPTGNLTNYLPVNLEQNNSGTTDFFRARVIDDVYTTYNGAVSATQGGNASFIPSDDPNNPPTGAPTSIERNFVKRSWVVTEDVVGGTNGKIMIQWFEGGGGVASDEPPGFDRKYTTIVHYKTTTDEWRCMDEVGPALGPPNVRQQVTTLITDNTAAEDRKMGVFSVASITAGVNNQIETCGAGSAQMSAAPLVAPLIGEWQYIQTANTLAALLAFTTVDANPDGITFASVNDANTLVHNLKANKFYLFKWINKGLNSGSVVCNPNAFAFITVATGSFDISSDKTLVWQGVAFDFWDCNNWLVEGTGNKASPNSTMRLKIPDVVAAGTGTYNPVLFTNQSGTIPVNLVVKNIEIFDNASFTLGYTTATAGTLTILDSLVTHEDGNPLTTAGAFINSANLEVRKHIINNGTFQNYKIPANATQPVVKVVGNFENRSTGKFVLNDNLVELQGNLVNQGQFFHTAGIIRFTSANNNFITGGTTATFFNVELNKDNDSQSLQIASTEARINQGGTFSFTRGKVYTYSNYMTTAYSPSVLTFMTGANYVGSNAARFVHGPVRRYVQAGDNFVFPIGKVQNSNDYWARLALSDLDDITHGDHFTAEYFDQPYSNTTTLKATPSVQPVLKRVSKIEHWQLDRNAGGTTDAKVTLYWENGTRSGIGNIGKLYVARFDGTEWDNMGGGGSTPAGSTTGSSSQGTVTSAIRHTTFSPHSFGTDEETQNPLPVEWLNVSAKLINDDEHGLVEWATAKEFNNDFFEIQRSTDAKTFRAIGVVDGARYSNQARKYQFLDKEPYNGLTYYRIRQVDIDGKESFSKIVSISRNKDFKQSLRVYPNPTNAKNVNLRISANLERNVKIRIYNVWGVEIWSKDIEVKKGINEVIVSPLHNLPSGVYSVTIDELMLRDRLVIQTGLH